MATLSNRNGNRYVQIVDKGGRRKGVPLGRMGKQQAEEIRGYVATLERAMVSGTGAPRKTAEWLAEIGDALYAKLAKVGLVEPREQRVATTLKAFIDGYIQSRTDLKPRSVTNLEQCRNALVSFFGAKAEIDTLNKGQMNQWRVKMLETLSPATVSAHVKKARQMFGHAVDHKLIRENPLRGVKAGSQANESRRRYLPAADVVKVIDACPSAEWRLIFALARFGGLRTPSETFALRWTDVDFAAGKMLVTSTKTEHHEGKATRTIPIFPELLPYLLDAHEAPEKDAEYVVARRLGDNLRTHADRLMRKAGVEQWPKPFQNMRVSCETDLLTRYPINWVIAWIGHTAQVQRMHYNTVPDNAYEIGSGGAAPGAAERTGNERNTGGQNVKKPRENPQNGGSEVPTTGVERPADLLGNLKDSEKALRWALRRLRLLIPDIRKSDVARLSAALAATRLSLSPTAASSPSQTGGAA